MDKIKRLVLGVIPNSKCNLKCEYCYISQLDAWDEPEAFAFSPEHIRKCLSKERLGGTSLINLTGNGETLLQPGLPALVRELLQEGHYVEIVTNCTVKKPIQEMMSFPEDLRQRLFFKASFHYRELTRLGILDRFFENIRIIRDAGASFTLELMAFDGIEHEIEDIKRACIDNVGAVCQSTIGRDDSAKDRGLLSSHSKEAFREIWAPLESEMLNFKLDVLDVKRKEFCYAGDWSLFVNMYTGESRPCYWQPYDQNIFEDPSEPIKFRAVGHHCTNPFCVNAHAHMCWGLLPELDTPCYAVMRNRTTVEGGEWLNEACASFFSTKLKESNQQYSGFKKALNTISYPFYVIGCGLKDGKRVRAMIKRYLGKKQRA